MLAGCVQQSPAVDPVAAVAQLSTGAPLLRCRADCVADWRRAQPYAAQLEAVGRWSELAALVITINYQDDLTLYYLARAAEGLGYPTAAVSYYRQSTYISGTSLSCQHESGVCGGVVLPNAALARIEALESEARRPRPRPPRHLRDRSKAAACRSRNPSPPKNVSRGRLPPRNASRSIPGPRSRSRGNPPPRSPSRERPPARLPGRPSSAPSNTGPAPPPPAGPESPPPARADPVAKQYIEPPAAR